VVPIHAQRELFQIVLATSPPCRLARCLNRGQKQRDQDANDGHHHEELNQRKSTEASFSETRFLVRVSERRGDAWSPPRRYGHYKFQAFTM
jgi:hypothetical protein